MADTAPTPPSPALEPASDWWIHAKRLRPYFSGAQWPALGVLVAVVVGALTEPLIPALMKPLLDRGFQAGKIQLWLVPVALIGLFAVRGFAGFVAQYGMALISNRAMVKLRRGLFGNLSGADPAVFSTTNSSALVNTIVYEVQLGTTLLVGAMLSLAKDSLTLIALLGYLLYLNWQLTLVVFAVFPAVAILMRVFSGRMNRITKASQNATDQLAYVVEENVLAYRAIRLHHAQTAQSQRFERVSSHLRGLAMRATVANAAMTPLTQMLAAVALSAVICLGLWQSSTTGVTVGGFVAFITAMLMLIAPLKHLSEVASPLTRGMAAVGRGLDMMERTAPETSGSHRMVRAQGAVEFFGVCLRYPKNEQDTLRGVNLRIEPGQTVALVGASGSGKTSLVNLLPRFVAPSAGRIDLDGVAIEQWDLASLRRQLALVSQDVDLINATLAENVALGETPDTARVNVALNAAHLAPFVETLPLGANTLVGHNGNTLSGGQRQRLAIARALYKDAPVLILDEATSALDSESEKAVQDALQVLMKNRTTIVVAHRLSTIINADKIAVMSNGQIVELGSHAELLKADGLYTKLFNLQYGGNQLKASTQ